MASLTIDKLHLAMLKRLNFTSYEKDLPSVDGKRPYGNKDVLDDLLSFYTAEMGYEIVKIDDGEGFLLLDGDQVVARGGQGGEDDLAEYLLRHHSEMGSVLEILAQNLGIQEGTYEKIGWPVATDWKLKEASEPRVVAVAVASSFTETDQDYVDSVLERQLQPTDRILVLPGEKNTRIWSYTQKANLAVIEEDFADITVDLAVLIFDQLMESDLFANAAPLELGNLAKDANVPARGFRGRP